MGDGRCRGHAQGRDRAPSSHEATNELELDCRSGTGCGVVVRSGGGGGRVAMMVTWHDRGEGLSSSWVGVMLVVHRRIPALLGALDNAVRGSS